MAPTKNRGPTNGHSNRDVTARWKDSNCEDHAIVFIKATLHGYVRKAKTRPTVKPKSQLSQRQNCEHILQSKANRSKLHEELKG